MRKQRILILCTGNSARSQMAEGLLRRYGGDTVDVYSAGIQPRGVNPLAVRVMQEIGIDISHHTSKDVRGFEGEKFDAVLTVCDHARESCPVFPGSRMVHWSTPDPETLESFRSVRDLLRGRVEDFIRDELAASR